MCFCSCRQKKQVSKLKRGSYSCECTYIHTYVCKCVFVCSAMCERGTRTSILSLSRSRLFLYLYLLLSHTHTYVGNCKWLEHVGFVVVATGFSTVRISRILTLFKVHTQTLLCVCVRACVCVAGWPLKKCFYCGPNMQIAWTALTTSSANKAETCPLCPLPPPSLFMHELGSTARESWGCPGAPMRRHSSMQTTLAITSSPSQGINH